MRQRIALCLAAALLAGGAAVAQILPGDGFEGRRFAEEICVECHVVGKGEYGVSLQGAAAFQKVADDPAVTSLSLRVFLRTPHEVMPDFMLSEAETDNVIAYILSMK